MIRALCTVLVFMLASSILGCGVKAPPEPVTAELPGKPERVSARMRGGCALIEWNAPEGQAEVLEYGIERALVEEGRLYPTYEPIGAVAAELNIYNDCELAPGGIYLYRVAAMAAWGAGKAVKTDVLLNADVPPTPAGLAACGGDRFVELSWDAEPGVLYNIYLVKKSAEKKVNLEPVAGDSFVDGDLDNGRSYTYRVRGVTLVEGYPMVEGSAGPDAEGIPIDLIAPSRPTGLAAAPAQDGVMLRWMSNLEPDLAGYLVYRRGKGARSFICLTDEPVAESIYLDESTKKGREYEYAVSAIDNAPQANESRKSSIEKVFTGH